MWKNYALVWPEIWIASAFKGATDPDSYYTDISRYVENHQRWLEIISAYSKWIKFKGIVLTGWQRYDHFSVLCELFAASLPSLAINLAVMRSSEPNEFPAEVPRDVLKMLECEGGVTLSISEPQYAWTKCGFLGSRVYAAILQLYGLEQEMEKLEQDNTYKGWMKSYNVRHKFSSPSHVEQAMVDLERCQMELVYVEKEIREAMGEIYDKFTIDEWVETFLVPIGDKIATMSKAKEKLLEKTHWPRRPLGKGEL